MDDRQTELEKRGRVGNTKKEKNIPTQCIHLFLLIQIQFPHMHSHVYLFKFSFVWKKYIYGILSRIGIRWESKQNFPPCFSLTSFPYPRLQPFFMTIAASENEVPLTQHTGEDHYFLWVAWTITKGWWKIWIFTPKQFEELKLKYWIHIVKHFDFASMCTQDSLFFAHSLNKHEIHLLTTYTFVHSLLKKKVILW